MHMQRPKATSHHQYLHLFRIRNKHFANVFLPTCFEGRWKFGFDHVTLARSTRKGVTFDPGPCPGLNTTFDRLIENINCACTKVV